MDKRHLDDPSGEQARQASERMSKETKVPQRDKTDESLRAERNKADARYEEKRAVLEEEADEVVRAARERAGEVIQVARDAADRKQANDPRTGKAQENSHRVRRREDAALALEHSTADAMLQIEREQRKRYLADFLAVERDATDSNLIGERAHTDAVVEARDEVLATVSHDVRTLLAGLALNAGLLMTNAPEGEPGEKIRKYAGMSQRMIAQMNRLVNDLLDVASIEAGALAMLPEDVEIATILRDTVEAFEPIAAARHITIDAEPPPLPLRARLDEGRILQVLANIVSNAIKFTPEGGKISIRIYPESDEIHFVVSDTGVGVPADELDGIFKRFRQVVQDRRGLGLGLHISKAIIEAHGGSMWAESEVGAGSTFHFVLPAL